MVWVPRGSVSSYRGASEWGNFTYVNELIFGDANVDGVVNTADLVEALNAKKGMPSTRFIQYNADQTGNGVDANDIKAIVEKIMNQVF